MRKRKRKRDQGEMEEEEKVRKTKMGRRGKRMARENTKELGDNGNGSMRGVCVCVLGCLLGMCRTSGALSQWNLPLRSWRSDII